MLTGKDRITADRWWRDPARHQMFQKATDGRFIDRETEEYGREFRLWAAALIAAYGEG